MKKLRSDALAEGSKVDTATENSATPPATENQLQKAVIEMARYLGWRVAHFRPAQTQTGRWVTAVEGDGKGFPDLVLVRPPRIIFAELKSEKGRKSLDQEIWLGYLSRCPGVEVAVWRPTHWDNGEIEEVLR